MNRVEQLEIEIANLQNPVLINEYLAEQAHQFEVNGLAVAESKQDFLIRASEKWINELEQARKQLAAYQYN